MATTFYYDFRDIDGFEYEIDTDEAEEYIKRVYSPEELIEIIWGTLEPEVKEDYSEAYGTVDNNFDRLSSQDKKEIIDDFLYDVINDTNRFDDELKDYFEQAAYEYYKDGEAQRAEEEQAYWDYINR